MQDAPRGIALRSQRSEFGGQTGEQHEAETEQHSQSTAQNLVDTDQGDAKWAHGSSCGKPAQIYHRKAVAGCHSQPVRTLGDWCELSPEFYSYRRASIGSSREAFMAGSMPLTMPTNPRINEDAMRVVESMVR